MFIPLRFFKRYLEVDDVNLIVDSLFKIGIQVENVYKVGNILDNIRIGKILQKSKHPNADKLWVCQVDFRSEVLQILTADDSVEVDDVVLVAQVGCTLPNGLHIEKRNIRGLESFGMMLSVSELGWQSLKAYGQGVSKFNFDKKISENIGKKINEIINPIDHVIEIQSLPNKVESLSVYYLSKEIAFILNEKIKNILNLNNDIPLKLDYLGIDLLSENCRYYKAIFLDNLRIDYSPIDFQLMLSWMDTKSVNNIVDLTNFLMYELSQPLHAFNRESIKGKIIIRQGKEGEILSALDGKDYLIDQNDLVISDDENKILALAGIIGSRLYSIDQNTKNVVIEIANFLPNTIRKTSKKLNLYTNSSKRFEKNIPSIYVDYAFNRFFDLLKEFNIDCKVSGFSQNGKLLSSKKIEFNREKIKKFIGIDFELRELEKILNIFCESYEICDQSIKVETYRSDINYWWDIAEELCRFKGYNYIVNYSLAKDNPEKIYSSFSNTLLFKEKIIDYINEIKKYFVNNGYFEVIGYNLFNPKYLEHFGKDFIVLQNYMSADHSAYRNSVLASVLKIASDNYKAGYKELKIFEVGKVFDKKEYYQLGFVVYNENKNFIYDIKKYILNEAEKVKSIIKYLYKDVKFESSNKYDFFVKGYDIYANNLKMGTIGILSDYFLDYLAYPPYSFAGFINLENLELSYLKNFGREKINFSLFPPIYKDISFYVKHDFVYEKFYRSVQDNLEKYFRGKVVLNNCYLIDIYDFEGYRSYAFRLEFKPFIEITNEEINEFLSILFDDLRKEGIERRG